MIIQIIMQTIQKGRVTVQGNGVDIQANINDSHFTMEDMRKVLEMEQFLNSKTDLRFHFHLFEGRK